MENQETYQEAKKRLKIRERFNIHLFTYFVGSMMLVIINLGFTSGHFWAKWPILAGSIVIFWQVLVVFIFSRKRGILEPKTKLNTIP